MALDISDGLSNAIENITKSKRYKGIIKETDEIGEGLTDKILNSRTGQAISDKLTDFYAFIENRGMRIDDESDDDDWLDEDDT